MSRSHRSGGGRLTRPAIAVAVVSTALWWCAAPAAQARPKAPPPPPSPTESGDRLARKVTVTGVNRHLVALQRISEQNGHTRAIGTPGFDASVDYVAGKLRGA